jgi:hypothetical protein
VLSVSTSDVGADLQLRAGGQHFGVDALGAGGEGAHLAFQPRDQFLLAPGGVGLVALHLEMPFEAL